MTYWLITLRTIRPDSHWLRASVIESWPSSKLELLEWQHYYSFAMENEAALLDSCFSDASLNKLGRDFAFSGRGGS